MIARTFTISMLLIAGAARAEAPRILAGRCLSKAELLRHLGREVGANAATVDARPCDKAILTVFEPGHVLVQFTGWNQPASQIAGFAGNMLNDTMLEVHTFYRSPTQKETAVAGHCLFSFNPPELTGITCIATPAKGPALVALFEVLPGQ